MSSGLNLPERQLTRPAPLQEFLEMLQQDASDHAAYETYTSFQASHNLAVACLGLAW